MFGRLRTGIFIVWLCIHGFAASSLEAAQVNFITNVDYNPHGQIIKVEYGNGVVTNYTYNQLNLRLQRIHTVNNSAQVLQDLNYTYDSAGNILSITDAVNTATQTFQYDALNRLTQAVGALYGTKTFAYDQIGNILQKDGLNYAYGENGAGPHAVTSLSDGTTFQYDANGNMTKKTKPTEVTDYTYDVENEPLEIFERTDHKVLLILNKGFEQDMKFLVDLNTKALFSQVKTLMSQNKQREAFNLIVSRGEVLDYIPPGRKLKVKPVYTFVEDLL
jgi:YD repeat-containing protein